MPLLYIDLLGMKSQWEVGGVPAARRRYRRFSDLVVDGLGALPAGTEVGGGVQSDAAALTFRDVASAVIAGTAILCSAFDDGWSGDRVWLRGLISPHDWPLDSPLEKTKRLPGAPAGVFERHFYTPLLNAINLEQSGFRGQRLLIHQDLVTREVDEQLSIDVGGRSLSLFRRLKSSPYPRVTADYLDVLWMVTADPAHWSRRSLHMRNLLRWSSAGGDAEVVQASATLLVFAQAEAMRFGLLNALACRGIGADRRLHALWAQLATALGVLEERHAAVDEPLAERS